LYGIDAQLDTDNTFDEDTIALFQMVIPNTWQYNDDSSTVVNTSASTHKGCLHLDALSVQQLRSEVRRLTRERAYLMDKIK
jgi:hypothetical protein